MANHETELTKFLAGIRKTDPELGRKIQAKLGRLDELGFVTVGDLWGSLHPETPADPGDRSRCLSPRYARSTAKPDLDKRTRGLSKAIRLPLDDTRRLVAAVRAVPQPLRKVRPSRSEWYLGEREKQRMRTARDYRVRDVADLLRDAPVRGRPEILSGLDRRIGPAWDQGRRGTCVAQSAAALFTYLTGRRPSRQFLFLQCKMIDGEPWSDGTYRESAMKVFSDRRLSGPAFDWGTADAGLPEEEAWPYDDREIPGNPAHHPPPEGRHARLYDGPRWANTGGEVLRCALRGRRLVEDLRAIVYRVEMPVVIGLPLYESFTNRNSRRTGWITLPFPGERVVGHHAMLVVGFDDRRRAFLVRNSWGTDWGIDNAYGCPGHAVIPYRYFELHGASGYSVRDADRIRCRVPVGARLFLKPRFDAASRSRAAVYAGGKPGRRKPAKRKPAKKRKKKGGLLAWILGLD